MLFKLQDLLTVTKVDRNAGEYSLHGILVTDDQTILCCLSHIGETVSVDIKYGCLAYFVYWFLIIIMPFL